MNIIRGLTAAPFLIIGLIFTWIGVCVAGLAYKIGGEKEKFDPLDLFGDGARKYGTK